MIIMKLSNGTQYRGRTTDSIIRREYGKKAFLRKSSDPNSPYLGQILQPNAYQQRAYDVLATVAWVDDE